MLLDATELDTDTTETPAIATEGPATGTPWDEVLDNPPAEKEAEAGNGEELSDQATVTTTLPPPDEATVTAALQDARGGNGFTVDEILSHQARVSEAEIHHKAAVAEAESRLAQATIRRVQLQAELSDAKKDEKRLAESLEELYSRGPKVLPLFDLKRETKVETEAEAAGTIKPDAEGQPAAAVPNDPPEASVGLVRIQILKDIEVDDQQLAHAGEETIAHRDDAGDVFIADREWQGSKDATGWVCAWLEAEEFELLDEIAATPPGVTTATAQGTQTEIWRAVPIEDLPGLSAGLAKILREDNEITTLGKLQDYSNQPNARLTDLKKIGKAKAEQIEEACLRYWQEHPEAAG